MNVQDRYKKVMEGVNGACARVRRRASEVLLVAVTKAGSMDQIKQVMELGQRDFGESRVQQLQQRTAQLEEWLARKQVRKGTEKGAAVEPAGEGSGVRWHMIGHLQRNKVRPVLPLCKGG